MVIKLTRAAHVCKWAFAVRPLLRPFDRRVNGRNWWEAVWRLLPNAGDGCPHTLPVPPSPPHR